MMEVGFVSSWKLNPPSAEEKSWWAREGGVDAVQIAKKKVARSPLMPLERNTP
jgi:hypothetical protein